jgi:hypothetical protein
LIKSIPTHPISLRSILISSIHLRLGLSTVLFHSGFPANILHAVLFSPFVLLAQDLKIMVFHEQQPLTFIVLLIVRGIQNRPFEKSRSSALDVVCCGCTARGRNTQPGIPEQWWRN